MTLPYEHNTNTFVELFAPKKVERERDKWKKLAKLNKW